MMSPAAPPPSTPAWGDEAPTTLQRTLQPGPARSRGLDGEYRRLVYGPGEPRLVRDDLAGDGGALSRELVSLLHIGHLTDMQIADVQSPARFEFLERLRGRQGARSYVPACRPQEALVAHAVAAMVETINRLATSPETGATLGLCVSTGDSLDNAQLNELQWFLALLGGGTIVPNSGGPTYQGVQAEDWEPALYWRPDAAPDPFKERFGFPVHPGLLAEAVQAFRSPGLAMPWLSCFGNHDGLVLGTALPTPSYEQVLLGARKPIDLPPGVDPLSRVDAFTGAPEQLLSGPARDVVPDPGRRSVGRRHFVEAHLQAGGNPSGHGFGRWNVESETAYGIYDLDGPVPVRVVLLDTTNMDGYFEGSIGARQLRWLEARLSRSPLTSHRQRWRRGHDRGHGPARGPSVSPRPRRHGQRPAGPERARTGPPPGHRRSPGSPAAPLRQRRALAQRAPAPQRRAGRDQTRAAALVASGRSRRRL